MEPKKLKIAMVLDNPFGPDLRVLREARTLVEAGNEVTIFAWDRDQSIDRPSFETIDGINIIRIVEKSNRQMGIRQIPHYFSFARQAFRLISQGNYDIVHCHDLPDLPIGVLLKLFKRVHLIYDAHEIYWLMEAKKYPKPVLSVIQWSEIMLMRFADAFITVGDQRAEYFKRHYSREIYVVGNWYNPISPSEEARVNLRQSLGIPQDDFVLTYAGTLSAVRGTDLLIDIADKLNSGFPCIHLVVAGVGPQQKTFEACAARNPNLHFLGWLKDTSDLYSASDALIYLMDLSHPYSQYNSPNNLYLSIAWGLPLIGIKAGEIAHILDKVAPELLVDRVDANEIVKVVNNLFENRELTRSIREKYDNLQSHYNWDLSRKHLMSAYNALSE